MSLVPPMVHSLIPRANLSLPSLLHLLAHSCKHRSEDDFNIPDFYSHHSFIYLADMYFSHATNLPFEDQNRMATALTAADHNNYLLSCKPAHLSTQTIREVKMENRQHCKSTNGSLQCELGVSVACGTK